MLTSGYPRRLVIVSSLLAAICASYVAGRSGRSTIMHGPDAGRFFTHMRGTNPDAPDDLLSDDNEYGAVHSVGGGITADLYTAIPLSQPSDARVDALMAMTEASVWKLRVRPTPNATRIRCCLEIRETGKAPEIIDESFSVIKNSERSMGKPQPYLISLMPRDGKMSAAKSIHLRVVFGNSYAVSQDIPNPFRNYSRYGSVDDGFEFASKHPVAGINQNPMADDESVAEVPLIGATFGKPGKQERKKVLFVTFKAQYDK